MEDKKFGIMHIYKNMLKMLEYRNIKINGILPTDKEILDLLNNHEYVALKCKRKDDTIRTNGLIYVILFNFATTYSSKTSNYKKIYNSIKDLNQAIELINISEQGLSKAIEKKIKEITKDHKIVVDNISFKNLSIEIPKHVMVPRHELIPHSEIIEFCRSQLINANSFAKINSNDPVAIWLGIRPGMFVKIFRNSDSSGISIAYRICNG